MKHGNFGKYLFFLHKNLDVSVKKVSLPAKKYKTSSEDVINELYLLKIVSIKKTINPLNKIIRNR